MGEVFISTAEIAHTTHQYHDPVSRSPGSHRVGPVVVREESSPLAAAIPGTQALLLQPDVGTASRVRPDRSEGQAVRDSTPPGLAC